MKKGLRRFGGVLALFLLLTAAVLSGGCNTAAEKTVAPAAQEAVQGAVIKALDIGQGDATLVRAGDQTILIDTGDVDQRDRLVKLLKAEKVTAIDKLIISHPHADHLGGAYAVLKNFEVRSVFDNGQTANTNTYRTYMKLVKEKKIPYRQLLAGEKLDFGGGAVFAVMSPKAADIKAGGDLNNNSIVGKLTVGAFSMLFTGDSEAEMEKRLLKEYGKGLESQVLKSPHHGSKTSSNRNYLKAVSPEAALISCGAGNDYKHPHQVTLNKYRDLKIKTYRTDTDGTITVKTDGRTYQILQEKTP